VICTLGETLEPFDSDGLIPAFGFGDISSRDTGIFPLKPEVAHHYFIFIRLNLLLHLSFST